MTAWWQLYRSHFTPMECEAISSHALLSLPAKDATVGHGSHSSSAPGLRRSTVRWLPRHSPETRWLFDRIVLAALEANQHAFRLALHAEPRLACEHAQFTEYDAADAQHYDWHEDNCWTPKPWTDSDRKLSCVLQLSDPATYDGGRLELDRDPLPSDKFTLQGDLLIFPSHLRHRVTPVTRGTRHSLVLWFTGPRLR